MLLPSFVLCSVISTIQSYSAFGSDAEECKNPVNCDMDQSCRGGCYVTSKRKAFCMGQCVSTNRTSASDTCVDEYSNCEPWVHLCGNTVVSRVCKLSCQLCNFHKISSCRGFVCDGRCVPLTYLCDGIQDCNDGADETKCNYFADVWFKRGRRRCGIRPSDAPQSAIGITYSRINRSLSLLQGSSKHGKRKRKSRRKRLVNARYAAANSWPWAGVILGDANASSSRKKLQTFCGVTLIHPEWAITAAHCVVSDGSVQSPNIELTFGKHYLMSSGLEKLTNQVRNASKILFFRDYDDTDIYNDMALIKLNVSVVLNEFVNVACLPLSFDVQQFYKTGGVTTGWGHDETGRISSRLKQALVKPMDRTSCTNQIFDFPDNYQNFFNVEPSLLCTEIDHQNGFGVICDGDSGGPLVVRRKTGAYALLGIASFGTDRNCSKPGEAAVYTNVYYFMPWIRHFVDVTYV